MPKTSDAMERRLPGVVHGHLTESLKALCSVGAPSGHEEPIIQLLHDHLVARGLEPRVDRLGQICVSFAGEDRTANSIMVSAHLDQLGLVVSGVRPDGYLKFERLGGVPERVLPGTRCVVHSRLEPVPAVVGLKSHHLTPPEEKYRALPAAQLYLDIGTRNREEVEDLGVRVGDVVSYAYQWTELSNGRFASVSLDDRLGVVALLALADIVADRERAGDLHIAFTTQEEFHVRGALSLVQRLQPDIVVNVDIAPAADTPDLSGATAVSLGAGPVINRLSFHGRGTLGGLIPHPALLDAAEQAARARCTSFQYEAIIGLINDAAFVPMATEDGVAAIGVSIPVRYTHSPVETAQLSDLEQTVNLLEELTGALATTDLRRVSGRSSRE